MRPDIWWSLLAALTCGLLAVHGRNLRALLAALGELLLVLLAFAWAMVIVAKDLALVQVIVWCVTLLSDDGKDDLIAAGEAR